MDLNSLWFVLIAVLYLGFFLLEGFDFGVGILLPVLGRDDARRRMILNTIGPHWDGNEVWLLTAGGATFAAFPHWYATLFSGFYLALFLLLVALILRGVALEFRSKDASPRWRAWWDGCACGGSAAAALLVGVAFGNLVRGVPIDGQMHYVGTLLDLLNPYALLAGLTALGLFTLHGALFLSLKTSGDLAEQAAAAARRLWAPVTAVLLALAVSTYFATDILERLGVNPGAVPLGAVAALVVAGPLIRRRRMGWAFALTALTILFVTASIFLILYPRVMISSLDPAWSLTIYDAASSPYTLRVMSIVALTLLPVVLAYQGWSYWVFRKRITDRPETWTY